MSDQKLPIVLNLIAALLGAFGQYAYKKGSARLSEVPLWQNYQIALGVLLFSAVMLCFVVGYKLGGRISVVYPFYATTFVWGALIGYWLEKEPFRWPMAVGILSILIGLILISRGAEIT